MSTHQLVYTGSKANVKSKTEITAEQSQKLIQTMLTMSFGCLAFLRGLFPDDSFADQRFVPEKVEKLCKKQNGSSGNSIKIKTLVRGKSNEIDLLLNWLERGVFQSIKLKYLKALSLGIFLDENDPSNLLENYTFSFDYDDDDNFQMNVGTGTKNGGPISMISLLDSRKMAQQLMRRFIIITQSLEPLPQRKFLTLRLMFNDNTPADYQPHLFKDATFEKPATLKIPLSTELDSCSVGSLNTSHHRISMKVLSAADYDGEFSGGSEDGLVAVDPFDLVDDDPVQADTSQHYANSQTTNILGDILKSSQLNIQPTQVAISDTNEIVSCECGMECPYESTKLKTCRTCRKRVHGICYGNSKGSTIEKCLSCVCGPSFNVESESFKDLMMLRKCYRFLARCRSFPSSIKLFVIQLFGTNFDVEEEFESRIAFCLSVLFQDNILTIDRESNQTNTQSSKTSTTSVLVDISGVLTPERGVLEEGTEYILSFKFNSSHTHTCFTDVLGESEEQVLGWLNQIKDLKKTCLLTCSSSCNLESLKIDDSMPLENSAFTRKRKNLDRHEYASKEQDPLTIDTSSMETPKKIRKISVSKKSLRSVW